MKTALAFVPALITFGPLFMVQGVRPESPSQYSMALGGALALGIGLALLFWHLVRQQQRIANLETELRKPRAGSV
jgi:hypothetical protein